MDILTQRRKPKPKRIVVRITKRTRTPYHFGLVLHDLADTQRYRVHRYALTPEVMAIRTTEEIRPSDLLLVGTEILKVARVEKVSEGCVEVKALYFPRYNK